MEQQTYTPAEVLALIVSQINGISVPVQYAKQIAEPLSRVVANIEVVRGALAAHDAERAEVPKSDEK